MRGITEKAGPYLLLAALGLAFFAPLVARPGHVLYSDYSDLLAEHLPAKRFLVASFRDTGELPLWCPYSYAGAPFVHDVQVAAFYPPHWLLVLVPEPVVGAALSWLVVLHVVAAGWSAFAYGRFRGLGDVGAFVAAAGFMFAGKWMLHVLAGGHYVLVGLAWLPLLLLFAERAARGGGAGSATAAGVVLALIVLGTHPQWTFYAGLFAVLWTAGAALDPAPGQTLARRLLRWALCWAWAGPLAAALAAVQLLPTLEASRESSRGGGVPLEAVAVQARLTLFQLFGPSLTPTNWEYCGGLGVVWLMACALAPALRGGRTRYEAFVALLLLLFSLGGAALLQGLPGFGLFRGPTRMLVVAAFPVAFLAGVAADALAAGLPGGHVRRRCLLLSAGLLAVALLLSGIDYLGVRSVGVVPEVPPYWFVLPFTAAAALALVARRGPSPAGVGWRVAWAAGLLLDLGALAAPLVSVRPESEVYAASDCVRYLARRRGDEAGGRVLDHDPPGQAAVSPLGSGAPLALVYRLESLRGYNPLDVARYKEYLQFVGDRDEPLRPLRDPLTAPVMGPVAVRNPKLLDLLGVRHVLQPSGLPPPPGDWAPVFEDPSPSAYLFVLGGVRPTGPYTVYENRSAFPRAFVVGRAAPLPERPHLLRALKETDFRREVLLENYSPTGDTRPEMFRPAVVVRREPNRVVVEADAEAPGFLVLADVWYPGWRCAVNGEERQVYRANYLFRAVEVPAGKHEVVFTFAPESYRRGRVASAAAVLVVLGVGAFALRRRKAR